MYLFQLKQLSLDRVGISKIGQWTSSGSLTTWKQSNWQLLTGQFKQKSIVYARHILCKGGVHQLQCLSEEVP